MRIALILLSILAMTFIGGVTWSLMGQDGWNLKTKSSTQSVDSITIETWKNQIKTDEKIEKLSAMVEELRSGTPMTKKSNQSPQADSGSIVKISGKLLSVLMPTMTFTLIENRGIFGLYIFDQSIRYSTYSDDKYGLSLIAMEVPYDTFLKNAKTLSPTYKVNEVKTFPMRAYYLNPEKSDSLVRLVIESESQAIALEISKSKFPTLKDLILGKSPVPTKKK